MRSEIGGLRVRLRYVLAAVALAGTAGGAAQARLPLGSPSVPVLGRCEAAMVKDLFPETTPPRPELHVLVARFAGSDEASQAFGVNVGRSLRAALEEHARDELKATQSDLPASALPRTASTTTSPSPAAHTPR